MATKRKVGNLLGLAVLCYLIQRPMHPYELSRTLRDNNDVRSIKFNHGSLYMVVGQLERAGFIAAQQTSRQGARPERTVYALTDAGRAEVRDWLRDLVGDPKHEYPQFVAALSLVAALPPDEVLVLLAQRLARLAEQRTEIRTIIDTATAQGVPGLFLVEEEYRLALLDAEVSFVESFRDRITDPHNDWSALWADFHAGPQAPRGEQP
ncbi:PadR family transcriptional regulator [Actinocatenispora thailandica]|uniref:PadR family transcriptional regulator n=1 Tax=Actinocatenispora thailandica TaxID=227318 RepID=A0A7R7DQ67_9ACTN|nr:PadR family transcriptional regulator [Actinocatenispora thailandica]BCJ35875.1 PadR family transcriptional regulator [Actinocatenispora thailandica]